MSSPEHGDFLKRMVQDEVRYGMSDPQGSSPEPADVPVDLPASPTAIDEWQRDEDLRIANLGTDQHYPGEPKSDD